MMVAARRASLSSDNSYWNFQVDNQLFDTQRPVMLFVTPVNKREGPDNTPALHVAAHKVPNTEWNAEIYKVGGCYLWYLSIRGRG